MFLILFYCFIFKDSSGSESDEELRPKSTARMSRKFKVFLKLIDSIKIILAIKPRVAPTDSVLLFFQTNERGETPLQVACINGNIKRVQKLLQQVIFIDLVMFVAKSLVRGSIIHSFHNFTKTSTPSQVELCDQNFL